MNIQGNGQPIKYRVTMSGPTKVLVKYLHTEAVAKGTGAVFLSALKIIVSRLEKEPKVFGEPLFHLPAVARKCEREQSSLWSSITRFTTRNHSCLSAE